MKRILPQTEDRLPVLRALTERAEVEPVLLEILPTLSAEEEMYVARQGSLGAAVLGALARSSRKRTLRAVVDHLELPGDVVTYLTASKHTDIAQSALAHPSLPSRERQRLWDEGERSYMHSWCEADPAILHRVLTERLAQLRADPEVSVRGLRRAGHLDVLPEVLDDAALDLVRKVMEALVERERYGEILTYSRTKPTGRALQDLIEVITPAEGRSALGALLSDVCRNLADPVFGTPVRLKGGRMLGQWPSSDAGSLLAAYNAGGDARLLALPHPALPAEQRREAVASSDPAALNTVALNTSLERDEIATLLEKMKPGQYWRLAAADLAPEEEERILAAGMPVLVLCLALSGDVRDEMLKRWFKEENCRYILENRSELLDPKPVLVTQVLEVILRLHPHLLPEVLDRVRVGDTLPSAYQEKAAEHLIARISDVEQLGTFCALLGEWQGNIKDLLDTTEVLGQ